MTEQTEPHDLRTAWPVIDGPKQGERIACLDDYFDALLDPFGPRPAILEPDRVRYYLRPMGDGRYVWSCAAPA
jgi:hypothetical protein